MNSGFGGGGVGGGGHDGGFGGVGGFGFGGVGGFGFGGGHDGGFGGVGGFGFGGVGGFGGGGRVGDNAWDKLAVMFGTFNGRSLSIKHDGALVAVRKEADITLAHVTRWRRALILATDGKETRFWQISPGIVTASVGLVPFTVIGGFDIIAEVSGRKGRAYFKSWDKQITFPNKFCIPFPKPGTPLEPWPKLLTSNKDET